MARIYRFGGGYNKNKNKGQGKNKGGGINSQGMTPGSQPTGEESLPGVFEEFDPYAHPRYQQALAGINAMNAQDAANARAAIQQALIAFGMVPEGFNDTLGVLDEGTRSAIAKNTEGGLSTYAQLLEARQNDIRALVNNLSARGLRRSGAKGAGLRKRQKTFDRNLAGALNKLLGFSNQVYGNYANNLFDRQMQLQDYYWQIGDQYGWAPRRKGPFDLFGGDSGNSGGGGDKFDEGDYFNPGGGRWWAY